MPNPSLRDVRVLLATRWPIKGGGTGYLLTHRETLEPIAFGHAAATAVATSDEVANKVIAKAALEGGFGVTVILTTDAAPVEVASA